MPTTDLKKYLFDIQIGIEAIEIVKLQLPNYHTFITNRILRSSVERELIIIGEVAAKILKEFPDVPISNILKIKDTRNIIVHDYDGVNYSIIWNIIQVHLITLKIEVKNLLHSQDEA
jgi:uncharacterized protein with HEPN domain